MQKLFLTFLFAAGLLLAASTHADEEDTMVIIEAGVTPQDIVNVITLPEIAAPQAQEKATGSGPEVAEDAKAQGKDLGAQVAEEAQARGRANAEEMRKTAEDVRRNQGKGRGRD